ncbi:MAG: ferredoxin [Actinomycetota bacterium]|nr:ferredoxin [Actinomycetota bacterium]
MSEYTQLNLNPTTCDAHGFCVELLPELATLDEWGYPLFVTGTLTVAIPEHLISAARKAAGACPVSALKLTKHQR